MGTVGAMSSDGMELTVTPLSPPTESLDANPPPDDAPPSGFAGRLGWPAVILVTLVGAALRLVDLGRPPTAVFDEVYYAGEGQNLLRHGVEWDQKQGTGAFATNPPLGKWLIGLGEQFFGYDAFGWRISAAIAGTLSILLVMLIARRLFGSTLLACAAGLLVAMDGLHLVLSRTAMLDIFLLPFILAGFACLVLDREWRIRRYAADDARHRVRWWLLCAGVFAGLAGAVKWSGFWFLPVYAVVALVWDAGARRSAGAPAPWRRALRGTAPWLPAYFALAGVAYLASWFGWFASDDGYARHWYADQHHLGHGGLDDALGSLLHYHQEVLRFWSTAVATHEYGSSPPQWLLLDRAVVLAWSCGEPCGTSSQVSEVLLLGTPLLWWSFLPALVMLGWLAVARTDWRAIALALCALAGILGPAAFGRPTFLFDALPAEPFLVLAVVYGLDVLARRLWPARRVVVIAAYVIVVAACFAYFYPVFVGWPLSHADWFARMWLGERWI